MMFLHGQPELGIVWRAQMAAFTAKGWRCIAPDMRGCGGSSVPVNNGVNFLALKVGGDAFHAPILAALRFGIAAPCTLPPSPFGAGAVTTSQANTQDPGFCSGWADP
jgi:pimeloyl-ACP methyl ester carboxylesterase